MPALKSENIHEIDTFTHQYVTKLFTSMMYNLHIRVVNIARNQVGLSREEGLLLICARLRLSADQKMELGEIIANKGLSWEKILRLANWQRLNGFLFYHLKNPDFAGAVPSWAMKSLRTSYFKTGLKNLHLQTELIRVLKALEAEQIPVIALKGAALLERVFPDPSIRPMSDIDLLVPEERADAAQAKVCSLGYAPQANAEEQERTRAVHRHLPKLSDTRGQVKFEIHTHVVSRDSPLRFDISNFWRQAREARVVGREIKILAPEHLLVHLAVHFFLDRRFRSVQAIGQICDIAEVINHYGDEIDWQSMSEEVITNGLRGPVYCGLSLAQQLLDAPIPEQFLDAIRPTEFDKASAQLFLKRRVFGNRRVIVSELVKPGTEYDLRHFLRGIGTRILPQRAYLGKVYGDDELAQGATKLRVRRLIEGVGALMEYLFNPLDLWREVQVDRWIHSVSVGERPPSRGQDE